MVEVFVLPDCDEKRIRLEAARIARYRREITRRNAIRELDRQIIRECAAVGLSRGAIYHRADTFMRALASRMLELERLKGEVKIVRNVYRFPRKGAAA